MPVDAATGPAEESWWVPIRNLPILPIPIRLAVTGTPAYAAFPVASLLGLLSTALQPMGHGKAVQLMFRFPGALPPPLRAAAAHAPGGLELRRW
jgi:hypothetical protein